MRTYLALIALAVALFAGCLATENKSPETTSMHYQNNMMGNEAEFKSIDRDTGGLEKANKPESFELPNGTTFNLEARPVVKTINENNIRMYAYNGQIPGPILKVKQGSTIYINFTNNIDMNTTVHWHGIRLENRYDGVPDVTQKPVEPSSNFLYKLAFPDEGIYWYHPHVREEVQQELGLYGVILVEPKQENYYNNVDLEEILVLDDILMDKTDVLPFYENTTNFAIMGRFGNTFLVNGETDYSLAVKKGERVRFFILNTANARPFNLSIENIKLKIIGGDSGKYEKEFFSDSVVILPSERYIFEVSFDEVGIYKIINVNPTKKYVLGEINVIDNIIDKNNSESSIVLKENPGIIQDIEQYKQYFSKPPDFKYVLTIDIPGAMPPDETTRELLGHTDDGIEWEDSMFGMNSQSTSDRLTWVIQDKETGKKNMDAIQEIPKNKIVKVRIENADDSHHPMQHAIHIHGTRFLVLKTDNVTNENLVWKDTVNIPTGSSVELLMYFPNEGEWMMHCHVAEHLSSGMMTGFKAV